MFTIAVNTLRLCLSNCFEIFRKLSGIHSIDRVCIYGSSCSHLFYKKADSRNFINCTRKYQHQKSFLLDLRPFQIYWKGFLAQLFSWDIWEIFQHSSFTEHVRFDETLLEVVTGAYLTKRFGPVHQQGELVRVTQLHLIGTNRSSDSK